MKLVLPDNKVKPEEQNKAKESGALTILLGKDDNVFYYEGILAPNAANFKLRFAPRLIKNTSGNAKFIISVRKMVALK